MSFGGDVDFAQNTALCIAAAATSYPNTNLLHFVNLLGDFFSNFTTTNATDLQIADFLGTTKDIMSLLNYCLGDTIQNSVAAIQELEPTLPHPDFNVAGLPTAIFFCIFTTIVFALSIFSRLRILDVYYRKGLPLDKWLLILGFAITISLNGLIIELTTAPGLKKLMIYDCTWNSYLLYSELSLIRDLLYSWGNFFIKASLLLAFYKIVSKVFYLRMIILSTGMLALCSTIAFFFNKIFVCGSHVRNWEDILGGSVCSEQQAIIISYMSLVTASINLFTDVVIWIIPIYLIIILLRGVERIIGVLVLATGIAACLASASRLASIYSADFSSGDGVSNLLPVGITTMIELNLGIFCACVPALRTLLMYYFPYIFSIRRTPNTVIAANSAQASRSDMPELSSVSSEKAEKEGMHFSASSKRSLSV